MAAARDLGMCWLRSGERAMRGRGRNFPDPRELEQVEASIRSCGHSPPSCGDQRTPHGAE